MSLLSKQDDPLKGKHQSEKPVFHVKHGLRPVYEFCSSNFFMKATSASTPSRGMAL